MANIGYVLDLLGNNPNNLVEETRTLTKKAIDGRAFVIPKATPFYTKSLVVIQNGQVLNEGTDYHVILPSPELSHQTQLNICGGIIFNTLRLSDIVTIRAQTIGGDFNLPLNNIIEDTTRLIKNPQFSTLSQIVGTPEGLPVDEHQHEWNSVKGFDDLIKAIELLSATVSSVNGGGNNDSNLLQHMQSSTAHTPAQVGLGNVKNYAIATTEELNATTAKKDRYLSPAGLQYVLEQQIKPLITNINESIKEISSNMSGNVSQGNTLSDSFNTLKSSFDSLNQDFNNLRNSISSLNDNLALNNTNDATIKANQETIKTELEVVKQTAQNLNSLIDEFNTNKQEIVNGINAIETSVENNKNDLTNITADVNGLKTLLADVSGRGFYPVGKIIPVGSYNFVIKPNDVYEIILIGAGGGMAKVVRNPNDLFNAGAGGATSLWCLSDLNNDTNVYNPILIAKANGGTGARTTLVDSNDIIIGGGDGGNGGEFFFSNHPIVHIVSSVNGEAGDNGYGVNAVLSSQKMGYEINKQFWGKGATGLRTQGQGGEGGKVVLQITNTLTKPLEFMVNVGEEGWSINTSSKATGGLCIINRVNV